MTHMYIYNDRFKNVYLEIQPAIFPFELATQFISGHDDGSNDEGEPLTAL